MQDKSVFNLMRLKPNGKGGYNYAITEDVCYYSERYGKQVIAYKGEVFDGATGAIDIDSKSWLIHDVLCRDGHWADGTPCNNWQASMVLSDILAEEGRWFRKVTWFTATWLFGGGKARDNGLF